jgi:hypothetical protein
MKSKKTISLLLSLVMVVTALSAGLAFPPQVQAAEDKVVIWQNTAGASSKVPEFHGQPEGWNVARVPVSDPKVASTHGWEITFEDINAFYNWGTSFYIHGDDNRGVDLSAYADKDLVLSFAVKMPAKGTLGLNARLLSNRNWESSGDAGFSVVDDGWQIVEIPYSAFPAGGFDAQLYAVRFLGNWGGPLADGEKIIIADMKLSYKEESGPGMGNFLLNTRKYEDNFTDIDGWFRTLIIEAYELNFVNGLLGTTLYAPHGLVSYAETIVTAARLHAIYNTGSDSIIPPPPQDGPWWHSFVAYAVENGLIKEGEYDSKLSDTATRGDVVKIYFNILPEKEFDFKRNEFISQNDVTEDDAEVIAFYKAGIVAGDGAGSFGMNGSFNRAQMAGLMVKIAIPESRDKDKTYE